MPENARRDLLKKAATLSIGALASASVANSGAGSAFSQADHSIAASGFFPGFEQRKTKNIRKANPPACCSGAEPAPSPFPEE